MKFHLDDLHLNYIRVFGNNVERPFMWRTSFVKNNQEITRFALRETYETICRYLDEQDVNYGILMFSDGIVVFSEDRVKPTDKLMFKLSTGMNYQDSEMFDLNRWFKSRPKLAEHFPNLLRDNNDKNS